MIIKKLSKLCHFCDCKLPINTKKREEPYAAEINNDFTEYYICDDCYCESCMDI